MALKFTTGLDGGGFLRGLLQIKGMAEKHGPQIGAALSDNIAQFVAVGSLVAAAGAIRSYAGNVNDLSDQYNIAKYEVQLLGHEAKKAGMSFDDIGKSLDKIAEARRKALGGDTATRNAFSSFGIQESVYGLERISNLDILKRISAGIGETITEDQRVLLSELIGEKGKKLLTLIQNLKNFQPISIITDEELERIDSANKMIDDLTKGYMDLGAGILADAFAGYKAEDPTGAGGFDDKLFGVGRAIGGGLYSLFAKILDGFTSDTTAGVSGDALPIPRNIRKRIEVEKKAEKEIKDEAKKRRQPVLVFPTDGDSLAKSGLFVRGGSNTLYDLQKQANKSLGEIASSSQRLLREIENRL